MRTVTCLTGLALSALALGGVGSVPLSAPEYTTDFRLESRQFKASGGNAYFSLSPGKFWRYEGTEDGEEVELEIPVLPQTKLIAFKIKGQAKVVNTRVIEEREWIDEKLVEVSRNFFARDLRGDVFYFGEDVDIYENGKIVSHDGAWRAGLKGALPGLIMPELFLVGARYHQEIATDVAMDRAEHTDMGFKVKTPAGEFSSCVKVVETSPLEPGAESVKLYAPGVGLVATDTLKLVEFH